MCVCVFVLLFVFLPCLRNKGSLDLAVYWGRTTISGILVRPRVYCDAGLSNTAAATIGDDVFGRNLVHDEGGCGGGDSSVKARRGYGRSCPVLCSSIQNPTTFG